MYIYVYIYTHTHTHIHIHTYIHIHIYIYTYIHIYMHVAAWHAWVMSHVSHLYSVICQSHHTLECVMTHRIVWVQMRDIRRNVCTHVSWLSHSQSSVVSHSQSSVLSHLAQLLSLSNHPFVHESTVSHLCSRVPMCDDWVQMRDVRHDSGTGVPTVSRTCANGEPHVCQQWAARASYGDMPHIIESCHI